jgi:NAD(P) transhydrogenase
VKQTIIIQDLMYRCHHVIEKENDVYRSQFARNGVDVLEGHASFVDPHTITIEGDGPAIVIQAERVVIATGTVPAASPDVPVGGSAIIDTDGIFDLKRVPSTMIVVGAGVIGMEYACMFATLGSLVTVVESRKRLLEFVDAEIIEALMYHMRENRVTFRSGESVERVERDPAAASPPISRAARRCAPTCSSTRWAARATPPGSGSTRRGSRPTTAAGCAWTTASAPPCPTSMPRAM